MDRAGDVSFLHTAMIAHHPDLFAMGLEIISLHDFFAYLLPLFICVSHLTFCVTGFASIAKQSRLHVVVGQPA